MGEGREGRRSGKGWEKGEGERLESTFVDGKRGVQAPRIFYGVVITATLSISPFLLFYIYPLLVPPRHPALPCGDS